MFVKMLKGVAVVSALALCVGCVSTKQYNADMATQKAAVKKANDEAKAATVKQAGTQKQLDDATVKIASLTTDLTNAKADLTKAQADTKKAQDDKVAAGKKANDDMAKVTKDLNAQIDMLKKELVAEKVKSADLSKQLAEAAKAPAMKAAPTTMAPPTTTMKPAPATTIKPAAK